MGYSITHTSLNDIDKLKSIWEKLEHGHDMTYYQTWHWNKMLSKFTATPNNCVCGYFVVQKENEPILIAPLWIIQKSKNYINKAGAYIIGRQLWCDYLNFIYKEFDDNAFDCLFAHIKNEYHVSQFHFERIKETSTTFHKLCKNKDLAKKGICVAVSLSETENEYLKQLSKSSKQNIRTARNRAINDGIDFEIRIDDAHANIDECMRIRAIGIKKKESKYSWHVKVLNYLTNKLSIKTPDFTPLIDDKFSHFLTITDRKNGKLAAFFNYGVDYTHKEIVMMAAGTNEEYTRYSPGIVGLYEFIMYHITKKEFVKIDFTMGNEKYKYQLGGEEHFHCYFTINI